MFFEILVFVFVIVLYYIYTKPGNISHEYRLPKGPKTVPIFGNLFQVLAKPHLKFSEWAYKYGNVYTLNILGRPALVVNDVKTMKEIFGTMESTGKFNFAVLEYISGQGNNGIFASEGKEGQEVRTFTMKALKDCGITRSSVVEPIFWQSFEELSVWLEKQSENFGAVIPIRENLIDCVSNIMWNIINRDRHGSNKSCMGKLNVRFVDTLQTTTNSGLLFLSWLKYVAPEWSGYNSFLQVCSEIHTEVQKYFDERILHRKNAPVAPADRNLLDAYLDQWENCTDQSSCFYGETGWKHCFYSIVHLLIAGGETTATTLNWLINYLVAYPIVQQKLYEEVNSVIGNRKPVLADRKRLPYLEAVIYETLRMSSQLPFGVIHRLLESVTFENYHLPKDTFLIPNIYHAHYDKTVWSDPENFRPERFLEVESGRLKDNVVAFQAGKRTCPGEGLAKDLMFLLMARLVQKYNFLPVTDKTIQDYVEPDTGHMLLPKPIGVIVKPRRI